MKIGVIVGSLRKKSSNRVLFEKMKELVPEDVEVYEIKTDDIPIYNEDNEFPVMDVIARLRDEFTNNDGVWLFTPEYNHSYPAHVKNIIDWLSRPVEHGKGNVIAGKIITYSGAGHGMSGTTSAQDKLVELLGYLRAETMNHPRVTIPGTQKRVDEDGLLIVDAMTEGFIKKQIESFIFFINERKGLTKQRL